MSSRTFGLPLASNGIDASAAIGEIAVGCDELCQPRSQVSQAISTLATATTPSSITSSLQDESHFHGDPELVDLRAEMAKQDYYATLGVARECPPAAE